MTPDPHVLIAGYGQMGHATEALLRGRAELSIWEIAPNRLPLPDSIRKAALRSDYLLLCVPTVAHAAVLDPLARLLPEGSAALTIAKGLDEEGRTAADILESHFGVRRSWGALGGPMIANEIIAGRPAFAELGSRDPELFARCRELYPERLRLTHTPDPQAVSWCGVLKNIYAPLIGIADELGWGDNARGHLTAGVLAEMHGLPQRLTGHAAGVYGDAGLADFVTTVTSASSHHYALGRRVARGDLGDMKCEGVHSLTVLQARVRDWAADFPLFSIAAGLVENPAGVATRLQRWLLVAP